ncbi:Cytochrome P450 - like 10 [Theobroma cacao]|nr:Cytochrome P450 - like 10 [Theobroma cacao]WRX23766.1 Cytochrome P450 - like 10 [Theobroma cacao]
MAMSHSFPTLTHCLIDLQLPEEKRRLEEPKIVTLCSEFFTAGTDTSSVALQWILPNLVKYPCVQEKLFMEIRRVIADEELEIKEDDLSKVPYLKIKPFSSDPRTELARGYTPNFPGVLYSIITWLYTC